ncbi:hypothetical protein T265_11275 [Opisthorchis viverrini]|uniref:Uncharacterized protein n=1 Tax=Opisthorchis viverrini TaxID=6198 RepID=A0A074Z3L0_OPIVI|nr:hypothetical protein T265_11275 [Opisthorchis viverrini]KER20102.1 hypothetical protein T265_11275 [Opisthorchis viverrini]
MYRLTPYSPTPESKAPAETLLYGTPRSTFDLLKLLKDVASTNHKMVSYYNLKHGAQWRHFDIRQSVFVKNSHGDHVYWRHGKITRRIGNVIYDVHPPPPSERQAYFFKFCFTSVLSETEKPSDKPLLNAPQHLCILYSASEGLRSSGNPSPPDNSSSGELKT